VNLILFEADETARPLSRQDPRAVHLLEILRRPPGEPFDAGIVDGPRGKGVIVSVGPDALELGFTWGPAPPPPPPLTLLVGLPRPQTARRILQEATALGVARMVFFGAQKGEPGYATSTLWTDGEWRRRLLDGAAQAFDTRVPEVVRLADLSAAMETLREERGPGSMTGQTGGEGGAQGDGAADESRPPAGNFSPTHIALDNYESTSTLLEALGGAVPPSSSAAPVMRPPAPSGIPSPSPLSTSSPLVLAFGPERGWSGDERDRLRAAGFVLAGLGPRVLRSETAVIAAVAVARAVRGWA
jgi:16S rRNA U1498 N3-methylase RsmE